jgi:hypothetical protein
VKYDPERDLWYVEIPRARNGLLLSIKYGDTESACDLCEYSNGCNRVMFRGGVWSSIMSAPVDESRLSTMDISPLLL